jgi:hypothetical protein
VDEVKRVLDETVKRMKTDIELIFDTAETE